MPRLGTQGNPQITVWQASGLEVTSPFTGYGLLIITGEIDIESDFEFHGLIVMTSNNRLRIKDGSTQEVHGGLIAVHESATEIRLEDDAKILYNSSDLATFVAPLIATGGNTPPVADAGPDQTVQVTDTVQLDGSGSTDVDGDLLTFSWTTAIQLRGIRHHHGATARNPRDPSESADHGVASQRLRSHVSFHGVWAPHYHGRTRH